MCKFIKRNSWFIAGLVMTLIVGLLLVYGLGFWVMVKHAGPMLDGLKDVTFPIWEQYSFSEHGYLFFYSLNDFENGISSSNHSFLYLIFMYFFYKIEVYIPQLPMRAVVPGVEMIFCVLTVTYVALLNQKEKIKLQHGVLLLLAVMFFLTMPSFWISAGKLNIDIAINLLLPLLLYVSYMISQGAVSGLKFWLPLGVLCATSPISGILLGACIVMTCAKSSGYEQEKSMRKLGLLIIAICTAVYLQPVIMSKILGLSSSDNFWTFLSGMDVSEMYFKNILNSYSSRLLYLTLVPSCLLLIQLGFIKTMTCYCDKAMAADGSHMRLFYMIIFFQYIVSSLLWPQAVATYSYLYVFMVIAPVSVWVIFNFSHCTTIQKSPQFWIWVMLFFISFNLQQVAQAKECVDCDYPFFDLIQYFNV